MKQDYSCITVKCDRCLKTYETGDGDIIHHQTLLDAEGEAENGDWITVGDKHFCEGCRPLCDCGHTFQKHDYGTSELCDGDEMKCPCASLPSQR